MAEENQLSKWLKCVAEAKEAEDILVSLLEAHLEQSDALKVERSLRALEAMGWPNKGLLPRLKKAAWESLTVRRTTSRFDVLVFQVEAANDPTPGFQKLLAELYRKDLKDSRKFYRALRKLTLARSGFLECMVEQLQTQKDEEKLKRILSVFDLFQYKDDKTLGRLSQLTKQSPRSFERVLPSLARIGGASKGAVTLVMTAARHTDTQLRRRALNCFGSMGLVSREAFDCLKEAWRDSASFQTAVTSALKWRKNDYLPFLLQDFGMQGMPSKLAQEMLSVLMNDHAVAERILELYLKEKDQRSKSSVLLVKADKDALRDLWRNLLNRLRKRSGVSQKDRILWAQTLLVLKPCTEKVHQFGKLFLREKDLELRLCLARILARLGPIGAHYLNIRLKKADKAEAAELLEISPTAPAFGALKDLQSKKSKVVNNALRTLQIPGVDARPALPALRRILAAESGQGTKGRSFPLVRPMDLHEVRKFEVLKVIKSMGASAAPAIGELLYLAMRFVQTGVGKSASSCLNQILENPEALPDVLRFLSYSTPSSRSEINTRLRSLKKNEMQIFLKQLTGALGHKDQGIRVG
ncbi:MAG: hypothetical protein P1V97_39075, partial [Planctomycetota bacterium]|nr:hypothetical protein [Planctomycetota bacterium]